MQPGEDNISAVCRYDTGELDLIAFIRTQQSGWRRALSVLLKRHQNALLQRCHYRLGNRHDAEDAVQETLLRAYRAIARFEGRSSFQTWLYAIADNQCNTLATRRTRHMLGQHVRMLIEMHERHSRFRETFEGKAEVNHALVKLPAKTRRVLKMRYQMGLSLEDIAHNLGIGLSAAKMRLYRAQDAFKHCYQHSVEAN